MRRWPLIALFAFALTSSPEAQLASISFTNTSTVDGSISDFPETSFSAAITKTAEMLVIKPETNEQPGVDWRGVGMDSMRFLAAMHAFRLATEPGTRAALKDFSFAGPFQAVGNMHGWADGDEFIVNYIGHPMQGAVSAFIWSNHDVGYKKVHFGKDPEYWKGRFRSAAFAYVLSVQFEVGPLSEASIGEMQKFYPAQGFVDHVITPVVGTGWAIGEDALDHYVIRHIEERTQVRFWQIMARSLLNPSRSFANLIGGKYPWHRTNRGAPSVLEAAAYFAPVRKPNPASAPGVAPFEFNAGAVFRTYVGEGSSGSCAGAGGSVAFRIAREWQIVADVSGCKLSDVPVNPYYPTFSETGGDSLTYVVGPRWTSQRSGRWALRGQLLLGGNKLTHENLDPERKRLVYQSWEAREDQTLPPSYERFAHSWDNNAFAVVTGGGADVSLKKMLKLRLDLEFVHTANQALNGIRYGNALQVRSGLVLTMGNW